MAFNNINPMNAPYAHPDFHIVLRLSPPYLSTRIPLQRRPVSSTPPIKVEDQEMDNFFPEEVGEQRREADPLLPIYPWMDPALPRIPSPPPLQPAQIQDHMPFPSPSRNRVILTSTLLPYSNPPISQFPSLDPPAPSPRRSHSRDSTISVSLEPLSPSPVVEEPSLITTISPGNASPRSASTTSSIVPSLSTPIEEEPFPKLTVHVTLPPGYPTSHLLNIGITPLDPRAPITGILKVAREPIRIFNSNAVTAPEGPLDLDLPYKSMDLPLDSVMLYPGAAGGATQVWEVGSNGTDMGDGWTFFLAAIKADAAEWRAPEENLLAGVDRGLEGGVGRVYRLWFEGQWGMFDEEIMVTKGLIPLHPPPKRAYRSNPVFLEMTW